MQREIGQSGSMRKEIEFWLRERPKERNMQREIRVVKMRNETEFC